MDRIRILAVLIAAGASSTALAGPPQCQRWHNGLDACTALGKPQGCTLVGVENEAFNVQRYAGTSLTACRQWIWKEKPAGYTTGQQVKACVFGAGNDCLTPSASDTSVHCVFDVNNDTVIDWNDASQLAGYVVDLKTLTPEPHCSCTPNGPYANVSWSGTMSTWEAFFVYTKWTFPKELKKAVLTANFMNPAHPGVYKSDAIHPDTGLPFDKHSTLQKINTDDADAAEVDHIIPRVDSQGCLCGAPTPANAAVISRELNGLMLNITPQNNHYRACMLKKYASCGDPTTTDMINKACPDPITLLKFPTGLTFEQLQAQDDETSVGAEPDRDLPPAKKATFREAPDDDDASDGNSGCAAGHTTGSGAFAGLAIALASIRRRRSRRSR